MSIQFQKQGSKVADNFGEADFGEADGDEEKSQVEKGMSESGQESKEIKRVKGLRK